MTRHLFAATLLVVLCGSVASAQQAVVYTQPARSTAAWTSATSGNTRLSVSVQGLSSVTVTLHATTTMTGGVLTFESDDDQDDTTWYATQCTRRGALTTTEGTFTLSVTDQSWTCPVSGLARFAVRLSTTITGSGTANVALYATAAPMAPQLPSGTVTTSNFPTTVDAGNGATSASTPRVTLSNDSTGQLKATNFPTTVDTNTGAAGASTLRLVPATGSEVSSVATATTTNAASGCAIVSAASTNATNCKTSAANFYGYELFNTTTTVYYLRIYNDGTGGGPTCSSGTNFVRSIPIPPAAAAGGVGGVVSNFTVPIGFSTGLAFCLTGGSSSTDNTNAAVGIFGQLKYK